MSRYAALYLGLVCLAAALCTPAGAAERLNMATLIGAFDQMALRDTGRVSKFAPSNKPLTLKVVAKFGDTELAVLDSTFATIVEQTKLQIQRDDSAEKPTFLVETTRNIEGSSGAPEHLFGKANTILGRLGGEHRTVTIQILQNWYRGDPYRIYRTLPHEIMHSVGFHGHVLTFDSVMLPKLSRNSMSEWDLLFLRVLYDPNLSVGTPRVFALPLACRLMHQRLIDENNPDVTDLNRSGPHPHCEQLAATPVTAKTPAEHARLGWAYLRGLGVARNLDEAEQWTRRALALNDPDAEGLLKAVESAKLAQRATPPPEKSTPSPRTKGEKKFVPKGSRKSPGIDESEPDSQR